MSCDYHNYSTDYKQLNFHLHATHADRAIAFEMPAILASEVCAPMSTSTHAYKARDWLHDNHFSSPLFPWILQFFFGPQECMFSLALGNYNIKHTDMNPTRRNGIAYF